MTASAQGAVRLAIDAGADLATALREAVGPVVTAILPTPPHAPGLALIRATVATVALERAPALRVNAIVRGGAVDGAVDGAAEFLEGAVAITGQVIELD